MADANSNEPAAPQAPLSPPSRELIGAPAALRVALVVAVSVLAVLTLPFLPWLVLAAWLAAAVRPWLAGLGGFLGGRRRAAAALTLALLVVIVGPILALLGALSLDAIEVGARVSRSATGREALAQLVTSDTAGSLSFDPATVIAMIEGHGARALELAGTLAGPLRPRSRPTRTSRGRSCAQCDTARASASRTCPRARRSASTTCRRSRTSTSARCPRRSTSAAS